MEEKSIKLELPLSAVEYILNLLSERPYKESSQLIAEIQKQASPQLSEDEAKQEA